MRIDFFYVDLLPKASIKGVSDAYANNGVDNELTLNKRLASRAKSKFKDSYYYSDILEELHKNKDSKDNIAHTNNEFISEENLLNLKKAIDENNYRINSKALLISLIKYTERI